MMGTGYKLKHDSAKTTRSSQGVQVMRLRRLVLQSMMKVSGVFKEPKVYRVKNIPAAGPFIKAHDRDTAMFLLTE